MWDTQGELAPVRAWTGEELVELRAAKDALEHPGLAAKIAGLVGSPIEAGLKRLPEGWQHSVGGLVNTALMTALKMAITSLGDRTARGSRDRLHRSLITLSGGLGGVAGMPSLAIELPVSTGIMLRSIADIARSERHDLSRLDVRLSCLEVFALGGHSAADDAAEGGYWAVRIALARSFAGAAAHVAEHELSREGAPALVKFISAIAARFSAVVTEEVAAKAIPVVGALSGGLINYLFLQHFQQMARGHFIIKRLEATHGAPAVAHHYRAC